MMRERQLELLKFGQESIFAVNSIGSTRSDRLERIDRIDRIDSIGLIGLMQKCIDAEIGFTFLGEKKAKMYSILENVTIVLPVAVLVQLSVTLDLIIRALISQQGFDF